MTLTRTWISSSVALLLATLPQLASPSLSHAQERSDLMPKADPPAANAPRAIIPGVTPPATTTTTAAPDTPAPAATVDTAGGGTVKGRGTAILTPDEAGGGRHLVHDGPMTTPSPTGAHLVARGDTLWGISTQYFGNPGYWPKLWSLNPSITNPHWIYPGDTVRLGRATATVTPVTPPERDPDAPPAPLVRPSAATGVVLRQTGFLEPSELAAAGTIVGSREEKAMLATLDEAYIEPKKGKPLIAGERYTVFRKVSDVKHPDTGKILGAMVEILGEVEVNNVTQNNNITRAAIVDALNPIERGDRVAPLRRQYKLVDPRPAKVDSDGMVVAALRLAELVGNEMLVFVDRGKDDGVEVGNRFSVIRRGDGIKPTFSNKLEYDKRYPREEVGQILILEVREKISTGVVVHQVKEARVGDRVEMRKGN